MGSRAALIAVGIGCWHRMAFQPEGTGEDHRINARLLPPGRFIAAAMNLAMVAAAQGDGELIADLAPHRPALCEAQVMGVRRLTTTNQTRLLGHISDVIAVANPARL
jgi:hypothetical protein